MGLAERDPLMAQSALLVRRTHMRADPDAITALAGMERADAVEQLLQAPLDDAQAPVSDDSKTTLTWWVTRIGDAANPLQDRMAFLWHTILPSHRYSVGKQEFVGMQLNTIRSRSLGNFRDLLQALMADPAMLKYLDAESSTAEKPNENLAREIMELFTIGIGSYTEADVQAAALALAGWRVDKDSLQASIEPKRAFDGEVTFLGETRRWDTPSVVDRLCDHPATAARMAAKLWYHFTGNTLSGEARSELGRWWQEEGLEIKPLLRRIMLDDEFWADHYARPRSGFEYYIAIQKILQLDPSQYWRPRNLGQAPYEPPNVGGWPDGDRWLNADSLLRRSQQLFSVDFRKVPDGTTATIGQILDRCGLWVVNDEVVAAMEAAAGHVDTIGEEGVPQLQWRIALSCPEFQLQ